ncbi:MAG: hypothetical protein P8Y95_08210, partial [Gammaproteobacteria bacterium]
TAAGNTQHDFLAWLARETGRVLVYENDDAREHARGHEIFGVRGQPIDRAISALNQASALRVELQDGPELRVALKS